MPTRKISLGQLALYLLSAALLVAATACASGSAIVTGTPRAPTSPDLVRLYLEAPSQFEVIGLVSATSDAGLTEQGSLDYAVAELKKQAAKLGANGLLIVSTSGASTKTVQARAILVK